MGVEKHERIILVCIRFDRKSKRQKRAIYNIESQPDRALYSPLKYMVHKHLFCYIVVLHWSCDGLMVSEEYVCSLNWKINVLTNYTVHPLYLKKPGAQEENSVE